jgi:hypothetical protein
MEKISNFSGNINISDNRSKKISKSLEALPIYQKAFFPQKNSKECCEPIAQKKFYCPRLIKTSSNNSLTLEFLTHISLSLQPLQPKSTKKQKNI